MASQNINLFQSKTSIQPFLSLSEKYVKGITLGFMMVLVVGSMLIGVLFYFFGERRDTLLKERELLLAQVKQEVAKESLFLMVRKRIVNIDAILKTQESYAPFIDTTLKIISSYPLASFTLGEKKSINIVVKVSSLEEATKVVSTLLDMERQKQITQPIMQSLTLDENKIQIGLSFNVVLANL